MRAAKPGPVDPEVTSALEALGGDDGAPFTAATKIADRRVELALRLYDSAAIDDETARWAAKDRARHNKAPGGRPAIVSGRQLLVLLIILALDDTALSITRARDLLMYRLSPVGLRLIGLDPKTGTEAQWYSRLWRARQRFLTPLDPEPYDDQTPGGRRKRMTRADYEALVARRDPDQCDEHLARLDWVANQLIEASLQEVPVSFMEKWNGDCCVDATLLEVFANRGNRIRNPRPDDLLSIEPGCGYYKGGLEWGYDLHITAMAPTVPRRSDIHPLLATAVSMAPCSSAPGATGTKALRSVAERGHPTGTVAPDRAYMPNSKPEHFQQPVRELGFGIIGDQCYDQLGVQPGHEAIPMIDGAFACPHMPDDLKTATVDYWVDASIDRATYDERIARRTKYLFRHKEHERPGKALRLMCPAAGKSPTANCTLRRDTHPFDPSRPTVRAAEPLGACCTKDSINVPFEAGIKFRQDIQFGTKLHDDTYSSARQGIEGFNALAKSGDWAALGDPTRRRSHGYANQFLAASLMVVAVNLHKLHSFLVNTRDQTFVPFKKRPGLRKPGQPEGHDVYEPHQPDSNAPPAAA